MPVEDEVHASEMLLRDSQITSLTEQRDLARAGIVDDDTAAAVRAVYNRIAPGEDGSKPTLLDTVAGWREDPSKAPSIVRGMFGTADSKGDEGRGGGGLNGKPNSSTSLNTASSINGELKQLREQFETSRDPKLLEQIQGVLDRAKKR